MANLSINAGNIRVGAAASTQKGTAGQAISAGQVVRESGGKWLLAQADDEDNAKGTIGIAITSALGENEPFVVCTKAGADFVPGAGSLTRDTLYVLSSASAGGIAPSTDLASTQPCIVVLFATSANTAIFMPIRAGNHF